MPVKVKICGLKTPKTIEAAVEGGAAWIGFVFFRPSPRYVTPQEAAKLARLVPNHVDRVGLFVNASDSYIEEVMDKADLELLQFHGDETPARVAQAFEKFQVPIMKAVGIRTAGDLDRVAMWEGVAQKILLDAKPPKDSTIPGGNAVAFDWSLLAGREWPEHWMLAGGLKAGNLADAVATTGATSIDVSSGVERKRGEKDPAMIRKLLTVASEL